MKNKGFSFIELLVAVAILGIISLPIASSFVLAARIEVKTAILSKINDAADDVMLLLEESKQLDEDALNVDCSCRDKHSTRHILKCVYKDYLTYHEGGFSSGTYKLTYNGYIVTLKVTPCEDPNYNTYPNYGQPQYMDFSRVDLTIDHEVNGSTYHVTRKGVLSNA